MANFPAPVGGTVYSTDFTPSLIFVGLYALLVPLAFYRMCTRRSRTVLLLAPSIGSVERIVVFSLRAVQSHNEKQRFGEGLVKYMQATLSMGYLLIMNDVVGILRCSLVNPTYGSTMYYQSPAALNKEGFYNPPPPGTPDRPQLRATCRAVTLTLRSSLLIGGVALVIYANSQYSNGLDDQNKADLIATLRTVSSVVALVVCLWVVLIAGWSVSTFRTNSKRATGIIAAVAGLISVVAVYRLVVMKDKTTSLDAQMSLNEGKAKAAFYIFHILPEWLSALILLAADVRKTFGTGPMGDTRLRDMTPQQHDEWLAKQAKKEAKRRAKLGMSANNETESAIPLHQRFDGP